MVSFFSGVLSFFSPCFLSLVPSYLSLMLGLNLYQEESSLTKNAKGKLLLDAFFQCLLFIIGFSIIFVLLGMTFSLVGQIFLKYKDLIRTIGGILLIIFGLNLLGILKIPFLAHDIILIPFKRMPRYLFSFFLGLAFAAAWTPCIGPILGSILTIATTQERVGQGAILLLFYSGGLAIPFLFVSFLFITSFSFYYRLEKFLKPIRSIAAILIILTGLFLLLNYFSILNRYFIYITPDWFKVRL